MRPSIPIVRIIVVAVGRLRPPFADDVQHYQKLIARHARLELIEVREDEHVVRRLPDGRSCRCSRSAARRWTRSLQPLPRGAPDERPRSLLRDRRPVRLASSSSASITGSRSARSRSPTSSRGWCCSSSSIAATRFSPASPTTTECERCGPEERAEREPGARRATASAPAAGRAQVVADRRRQRRASRWPRAPRSRSASCGRSTRSRRSARSPRRRTRPGG